MQYETDFSIINDLIDKINEDFPNNPTEVFCFPQTWGSTSLGYGGFGGSAMSNAHTIIIHAIHDNVYRMYFGCIRLAYEIKDPNQLFMEDLRNMQIKDKSRMLLYLRD